MTADLSTGPYSAAPVMPVRRRPLWWLNVLRAVFFLAISAWSLIVGVRGEVAAAEHARAAAGPVVTADVLSRQVIAHYSRSGTWHTTAYRVRYIDTVGHGHVATVTPNGADPCGCTRTQVAYDPAAPGNAVLAGAPAASPAGDWVLITLGAGGLIAGAGVVAVATRGRTERRRALPRRAVLAPIVAIEVLVLVGVVMLVTHPWSSTATPTAEVLNAQAVAAAVAGRGTGVCLAASPTPANYRTLPQEDPSRMVRDGLAGLDMRDPAGTVHYTPPDTKDHLGSALFDAEAELGGPVDPVAGQRAIHTGWTAQWPSDGFVSVAVRPFRDPAAAARAVDAWTAAECLRAVGGSPARLLPTPADLDGARFVALSCGCSGPGAQLVRVDANRSVGRYLVTVTVAGQQGMTTEVAGRAADVLTRATSR